jgi:hypothetical protein
VAVCLQPRGQRQHARFHGCFASRLRDLAFGPCRLQSCVEECMASLTQKHTERPRLACACGNFLLFWGQRERRVPPVRLLTVASSRGSSTSQSTDSPCLSTLYAPLPKPLVSVLGGNLGNQCILADPGPPTGAARSCGPSCGRALAAGS